MNQIQINATAGPVRPDTSPFKRRDLLLPLLVLVLSLLTTQVLWQETRRLITEERQNEFDIGIRETQLLTEHRLADYAEVLYGMQALYAASNEVSFKGFSAYTKSLRIEERYSGIVNLAYSAIVPDEQKVQHIAATRKQGFPDYAINPEGQRNFYAPTVQLETFHNSKQQDLGLDSLASGERRSSFERARDSATLSITGKLLQPQGEKPDDGHLLMVMPVYRNDMPHDSQEARQNHLLGWVSATFRMQNLMSELITPHNNFSISVYDGTSATPDTLLYNYASGNQDTSAAIFHSTRQIMVADRLWTLNYASSPEFDAKLTNSNRLRTVTYSGIAASLLLALITWLLLYSRRKNLSYTARLERAKQQAEIGNKSKSEFLANISHELRTPMNVILGMLHLILRVETDNKKLDLLEKAQFASEHLLDTIDNILDLANLESGRLQIAPFNFSLREILTDLEKRGAKEADKKGLKLILDVSPDIYRLKLHGDAKRITQVLYKYIDNAIKFSEQGEIIIRVLLQEEHELSCRLRFEVEDSGIGISPDLQPHLFEPFWQADSSSTRAYEGTGLSLAISKELVGMMRNGEVGAKSIPGKGSTFWFSVRLDKIIPTEKSSDGPLSLDQFFRFNGARILLAEDNSLSQMVMRELLEEAGASVNLAESGVAVLEKLRQNSYDCVLMDIQMPLMDGIDATRAIRSELKLLDLPIIAVTAHTSEEKRKECLNAGMNDFIGKPFTPSAFYDTVAHWLPALNSTDSPVQTQTNSMTSWSGDPEVIDLSILAELIGSDRGKMYEFATKFLNLARGDMIHIESAVERNDLKTLGRLAHHNMAPARMVGAIGFAELCGELDEHSKNAAAPELIRKTVIQMRPLLGRIEQYIQTELA